MGSEALEEFSRLTNGEAENSLQKQTDQVPPEGLTVRCENLLSDGTNGGPPYCDANPGKASDSLEAKKKARQQKEVSIEDIYQNQDLLEDEDDDDSDWEPIQKSVEIMKWFCTNCTMVNLDDIVHCDICGEHKDSKILRYGFFASPFAEDVDPADDESTMVGRKGVFAYLAWLISFVYYSYN